MAQISLERKKELQEPDEFQQFLVKALIFSKENRKWVTGVSSVVVALIVIVSITVWAIRNRENSAAVKLTGAFSAYAETMAKDPNAAYLAHKDTILSVLNEYSGAKAASYGRIRLAGLAMNAGDADTALSLYETAWNKDGNNPAFCNLILTGLAYAYEAKGDTDSAIKQYELLLDREGAFEKDQALYNLGRLYESAGKTEKSRETWQQLVEEHGDSIYYSLVSSRLAG